MEGAALAEALLLEFSDLSMKVLVTTHYNALKVLAHASPGFQNASLEFDVATLSPTYRLIMGLPGGSSAIEIAGRLGMDERILEQARHRVHREDQMLERMLGDLQAQQRRVEQDRESARELRVEAERAAREAQELADRLRVTERDERKRIKKTLTDELLRARAQIQEVLESLKRERTVINARQAKQDVAAIEEEVRPRLSPSAEIVPIGQLSPGAAVEILGLGTTGTLLEPPHGKKRVRVRVGERELSVGTSQLTGAGRSGDVEPVRKTAGSTGRRPAVTFSDRPAQATAAVDLRGKTAEEALDCTVAALDEAVLAGTRAVRLIHGHGTGRLKAVLRDYLKASPYVAGYRAGERPEGGDGVTIVQLKD